MKNNFKGSKGEVELVFKDRFSYIISNENKTISINIKATENVEQDLANAELTTDAFNIRQQINCDLPELLDRYNKAVELLERIMKNYDKGTQTYLDCTQFLKTLE